MMKTLTKPGPFLLILFGLATTLFMLFAFYLFSLPFFNMFEFEVIQFIVAPLLVLLLICFLIDKKYKTKLKRYSIVAILLLPGCLAIFPTVKAFIVKDTELRGEKLVKEIKNYKLKYGFLPKTLNEPFFKNCSTTALVHRQFYYYFDKVVNNDTTFIIYTYSFDGMRATLHSNSAMWYYFD